MTIAEQLRTALDSLAAAYATACETPKPTYSIDGQSVSWGEYLRMLSDGIKATAELLSTFDPVELRSIAL